MYKTIKLSVPSLLAISLIMTGCSQQPVNLAPTNVADIQSALAVKPIAIDAQVQNIVKPRAPKVYNKPRKMAKPIQRMAKPVQRQIMHRPIQRQKMMSSMKRSMVKPTQRHVY